MGQLVCIDTNVLIRGIKHNLVWQTNNPPSAEQVEQMINFLEWLDNEGAEVIVPAVCVAEFLMLIPQEEQPEVLTLIQKKFKIVPSDAAAASHFGKIWRAYLASYDGTGNTPREKIKIDDLVLATAIAQKAATLYSTDNGIQKMSAHANCPMVVRDIPNIPKQLHLPEE